MMISASVGNRGVNRPDDVRQVQERLNRFAARLELEPLQVDGDCGTQTRAAIISVQDDVMGVEVPDGRVDPGGAAWQRLDASPGPAPAPTPRPQAGPLATLLTPGPRTPLAAAAFAAPAGNPGGEVAGIGAGPKVESPRNPSDDLARP